MQNMTDEDVMLHYQQGNGAAMEELLKRYRQRIYQFSYRLCRNSAEAEDVAQEVFLRVHLCRSSYVPQAKFSTWIFGIAHNLVIDRLRRLKWLLPWPKTANDPSRDAEFAASSPSPQDAAAAGELGGIVREAVQKLPFLQKEAIILREYQQMSYAEISNILNVSPVYVKTLIHRARLNLKERLLPCIEEGKGVCHV